jgi:hypothetical protein
VLLREQRYPPASILHGDTTTVLPPLQRFVDKEGDPKQVSESDIQAASLEKLKEWFGRESADWDSDEPTVPSGSEKELIRARMQILEPAAKGSGAPKNPFADEEVLPVGPTPEEIRDKAASELRKEIDLGIPQAVSVGRENGASSSGVYRKSKLTGTADSAYAFYANGVQQTRINPEWHVHVEESGTLKNPGFKKHADKLRTGPGTRRVTDPGESRTLYAACRGPK